MHIPTVTQKKEETSQRLPVQGNLTKKVPLPPLIPIPPASNLHERKITQRKENKTTQDTSVVRIRLPSGNQSFNGPNLQNDGLEVVDKPTPQAPAPLQMMPSLRPQQSPRRHTSTRALIRKPQGQQSSPASVSHTQAPAPLQMRSSLSPQQSPGRLTSTQNLTLRGQQSSPASVSQNPTNESLHVFIEFKELLDFCLDGKKIKDYFFVRDRRTSSLQLSIARDLNIEKRIQQYSLPFHIINLICPVYHPHEREFHADLAYFNVAMDLKRSLSIDATIPYFYLKDEMQSCYDLRPLSDVFRQLLYFPGGVSLGIYFSLMSILDSEKPIDSEKLQSFIKQLESHFFFLKYSEEFWKINPEHKRDIYLLQVFVSCCKWFHNIPLDKASLFSLLTQNSKYVNYPLNFSAQLDGKVKFYKLLNRAYQDYDKKKESASVLNASTRSIPRQNETSSVQVAHEPQNKLRSVQATSSHQVQNTKALTAEEQLHFHDLFDLIMTYRKAPHVLKTSPPQMEIAKCLKIDKIFLDYLFLRHFVNLFWDLCDGPLSYSAPFLDIAKDLQYSLSISRTFRLSFIPREKGSSDQTIYNIFRWLLYVHGGVPIGIYFSLMCILEAKQPIDSKDLNEFILALSPLQFTKEVFSIHLNETTTISVNAHQKEDINLIVQFLVYLDKVFKGQTPVISSGLEAIKIMKAHQTFRVGENLLFDLVSLAIKHFMETNELQFADISVSPFSQTVPAQIERTGQFQQIAIKPMDTPQALPVLLLPSQRTNTFEIPTDEQINEFKALVAHWPINNKGLFDSEMGRALYNSFGEIIRNSPVAPIYSRLDLLCTCASNLYQALNINSGLNIQVGSTSLAIGFNSLFKIISLRGEPDTFFFVYLTLKELFRKDIPLKRGELLNFIAQLDKALLELDRSGSRQILQYYVKYLKEIDVSEETINVELEMFLALSPESSLSQYNGVSAKVIQLAMRHAQGSESMPLEDFTGMDLSELPDLNLEGLTLDIPELASLYPLDAKADQEAQLQVFFKNLDSKGQQTFLRLYRQFAAEVNHYLKDKQTGNALREALRIENGLFCFKSEMMGDIFSHALSTLAAKNPELTSEFQNWILQDTYYFWNLYSYAEDASSLIRENTLRREAYRQDGSSLLYPATSEKIVEVFLKVKYGEFVHHIKQLSDTPSSHYSNLSIPCFFVFYEKEPVLTLLMAHFDERGFLYALSRDKDEIAHSYARETFGIERVMGGQYVLTSDQLESFQEVLSGSHDRIPFLLLEQKKFIPIQGSEEQTPRMPKDKEGETGERPIICLVPRTNDDGQLPPLKKPRHVPLSEVFSLEEEEEETAISGSFWTNTALQQCGSIQKKLITTKKTSYKAGSLEWKIPSALLSPEEGILASRSLYMLQAKPYQQTGIDRLCDLSDLGLSGILAWQMGLGKTLAIQELIGRYIASGKTETMVVFTLNAVRPQTMAETKERLLKAIFATLYATLVNWKNIPEEEREIRLKIIKDYIYKKVPDLKNPRFKHIFKVNASNFEAFKEVLILVAALPDEERRAFLGVLGLNSLLMFPHLKTMAEMHQKRISASSTPVFDRKKSEEELLSTIAQYLVEDPHYPYQKAICENFPGKDLSQFQAFTAYPCDDDHLISGIPSKPKKDNFPCIYFVAYHEVAKGIERFSEEKVGMVVADEFHTLAYNKQKQKKSQKNEKMQELIQGFRKGNPSCQMYACSGTPVRGDLVEFFDLFGLFNPGMIPSATQHAVTESFKKALRMLRFLAKSKEESIPGEALQIFFEIYSQLLTLNFLFNKLAVKAKSKDSNVSEDWLGRIQTKRLIPLSFSAIELKIHTKAIEALETCNQAFIAGKDINDITQDHDYILIHKDLYKSSPKDDRIIPRIVARINNGGPEKNEKKLKKSYLATLLLSEDFKQDIADKKKIVVNVNYRATLEILKAYIERISKKEAPIVYLYNGETVKTKRGSILENFNKTSDRAEVLLLSIGVGSAGLNLPIGHKAYNLERSITFDPFQEKQAMYRIIRVNQDPVEKPILVLDLSAHYLVEKNRELIYAKKKGLAKCISRSFISDKKHISMVINALKYFVQHAVFKSTRKTEELVAIDSAAGRLLSAVLEEIKTDEAKELLRQTNPFLSRKRPSKDKGKEKIDAPSVKRSRTEKGKEIEE